MPRARQFVLNMKRVELAGDGYGNYTGLAAPVTTVRIAADTLLETVRIACRIANREQKGDPSEDEVVNRYWRVRTALGKLGTDFGNGWLAWRGK